MFTRGSIVLVAVLVLVLGILVVVFAATSPAPNTQFADAATAILVISAIAVGIERVVEIFWSIAGSSLGTAWPFEFVMNQFTAVARDLDSGLKPYQEGAAALIQRVAAVQKWSDDRMKEAMRDLDALHSLAGDARKYTKDYSKLQATLSTVTQHINYIEARYTSFLESALKESERAIKAADDPAVAAQLADQALGRAVDARVAEQMMAWRRTQSQPPGAAEEEAQERIFRAAVDKQIRRNVDAARLRAAAEGELAQHRAAFWEAQAVLQGDQAYDIGQAFNVASQAITGVNDFVATFQENPGRRILSLLIGAILGVILAGLLGLDLFQAVLDEGESLAPARGEVAYLVRRPARNPLQIEGQVASPLHWGVVLTGILIGLGAEPTHQVIKILQESKKRRKSLNSPDVQVAGGEPGGEGETGVLARGGPSLAPTTAPIRTAARPRAIRMR